MAKCLASSQSELGWHAALNGLSGNGWNVLDRTFQELRTTCQLLPSNCEVGYR